MACAAASSIHVVLSANPEAELFRRRSAVVPCLGNLDRLAETEEQVPA